MKRFLGATLVIGVMMLWAPSTAQAITIAANCGTCGSHATQFDISFALVDATTHTYDVTIVATYVGPTFDWNNITAVGVNVAGAGIDSFVSVTGPDGQSWTKVLGSLNQSGGNGCTANPGEAFACTDAAPGASRPGPDTWVLRLDFDTALDLSDLDLSFKARFTQDGQFVGPLLSEGVSTSVTPTTSPTTPTQTTSPTGAVPEPTSLLLLGSGLVLAHQRLRRRRVKA